MKKILPIAFLVFWCLFAGAQEQLSKKQLADKAFERYEYFKALNLYLSISGSNNAAQVAERIADCYRLMGDNKNAESWYAGALGYDNAAAIGFYYYAETLLRNNKLKEAKTQYEEYYKRVNEPEQLRAKLAMCDSAAAWIAAKQKAYTVQAEKKLNGPYSDWGVAHYGAGSLVFTSNRADGTESAKQTDERTGSGFYKLYIANSDSVVLLPISKEGKKTFNGDYHAGPVAFNKGGDTAWITITTTQAKNALPVDKRGGNSMHQRLFTRRLMLVMAVKQNGVWGDFKNFAYNNIKEFSTGHAALSADGSVLYFASDRPGGQGGTDIWYCQKQADGNWAQPVNCGSAINTKGNEGFPTVIPDGLAFASDGLPGMGGLDIFISKGAQSNWSTPVNPGYPANSTADDFYYTTQDGRTGYISSNRDGGSGSDDIYSFVYTPLTPEPHKPLVPKTPDAPPADISALRGIIYYDLDKSAIRTDAAATLDSLVDILKANPTVKVKLASYTDVRASGSYNIGLSKRRSEAAKVYLIEHGIDEKRLTIAWYGKENPVADCPGQPGCPESQHQLNRRTEIFYDGVLE
ncbi:OmpA family protein [Mucilaginibacter pedocola]|uniref:OmpA-like domain-containing protein n=1 Tax=Mucilaginibacter pedocola TaxID=1792845 RepID=A0A1S9PG84_9SPHI|nr:OmpA family protein [Mucilaginibacter pedocola]OOQ59971.1 hypothetical protein BC343_27865 [Mucilaginibacter pedocola]